jgi:hypothetical protein
VSRKRATVDRFQDAFLSINESGNYFVLHTAVGAESILKMYESQHLGKKKRGLQSGWKERLKKVNQLVSDTGGSWDSSLSVMIKSNVKIVLLN